MNSFIFFGTEGDNVFLYRGIKRLKIIGAYELEILKKTVVTSPMVELFGKIGDQ